MYPRIYGFDQASEGNSDTWQARLHLEDRERLNQAMADHLSGKTDRFQAEFRFFRPDLNDYVWLSSQATITERAGDGAPLVVIGTTTDITERKQGEEEILRQRGMMEGLIQSIPDLVYYKNIDGMYMGCNTAFAELLGKRKDQVIERTDFDLFDQETAVSNLENDRLVIADEKPFAMENWETYPDGRKALFQTLKTGLRSEDGRIIGVLGISRDVTEAHRLQEEIEEAKANLDIALTAAKMGAWKYDVAANHIDGDVNTIRLYGLDDVEMTGDIGQWFTYVHPDDAVALGQVMAGADRPPQRRGIARRRGIAKN
jgi:PAS domain S-box-containing protein